jgi:PKD repeat protein
MRYAPGTVDPMPLTGGCPTNDAVGSSSNVFTQILTEANPVAVDNDINSIIFVHRNNAGVFGGHSGQLRYDITTDGGATWTNNQGVLNPLSVNGTNGARYPNVAIYNPAGNTVAANAYLGYYAATVAATFNGTVSGVRRLNGTGNTETYNQPVATQTLIPRSIVKGAPGIFWGIDNVYNGTAVTGYRVLKGTWNGSTDIVWSVNTTINPTFNTAYDGTVKTSDYAIAFDPTGTIGWVCLLTQVTPGPSPYAFYPVFYKTTDGGTSWSGPTSVDLNQYPCISSNILLGNTASTGFDMDLTVDVNGNPHALMPVCNGNNAYAVFFGSWHAMVDVTLSDGVWNPVVLRNVYRGRGTWGTAPNAVTLDMESQIARSADGTKIFYAWADADSSVVQATADVSPNLFAKAYDVVQRKWTNSYNFTSCNVTWGGKILFPKMAETVLSTTGNYKMAVVFAELGTNNDPINPANFHYLDSLWFAPSDFVNTQCQAAVSISNFDTLVSCGSLLLDAGPGAQVYAWSNGASTQAINVTTSGMYKVGVSSGCCTGSDSVYVMMISAPTTNFSAAMLGFTGTFTDNTGAQLATYLWDFGDGNTSTLQNPSHTYAAPGSYNVCLTVTNQCGSDSSCTTVVASCAAANAAWNYTNSALTASFTDMTSGTPSNWAWDFGDGNTSTTQNPTHTYAAAGTYNVCLTITDSCGTDSTCMPVDVCALPIALIDTPAIGDIWVFMPYQFMDLSTSGGGTTWLWDFGDGGVSSQQNPTYTYSSVGQFTVCLTVTDSCGADTTCIQIDVMFESVEPGLAGQWSVSPVPTHEHLLVTALDAPAGDLRLRLVNTLGQVLLVRDHAHVGGNLQTRLDLGTLPTGIYFLEVRGETGRYVAKVIKH